MNNLNKKISIKLEETANKITRWIGSVGSIVVHTILFIIAFVLYFLGIHIDKILLVVTTIVSLEAIYLAIFIQMSVNQQSRRLGKVAEDIDEIQEDVQGIEKDVDEIQEDVEEIEKDIDEIQEEIVEDEKEDLQEDQMLLRIEDTLGKLIGEITELKKQQNKK